MKERRQGGALPARCEIGRAEVRHDRDPRPFVDDGCRSDLESPRDLRLRKVSDRLAVRSDPLDAVGLDPRFPENRERRIGKAIAQLAVEPHPVPKGGRLDEPVDAIPKGRVEGLRVERQHLE